MQRIKLVTEDKELNRYFTEKMYKVDPGYGEILCYVDGKQMDVFCDTLSEYIWNHNMKFFLRNYTRKNPLLTREEAEESAGRTLSVAMSIKDGCDVVKEKLKEFFEHKSRILSLEGFVRFRLRDLKKDLLTLADLCIDEMVAKREYEDFITLLRSFVEMQTPSDEPVFLKVASDGSHKLLDENGREIITKEEKAADIAPDDLILSALVSCSPGKIFLYNEKSSNNPQLLDTIKSIFAGRVFSVNEKSSFPASPNFWQLGK